MKLLGTVSAVSVALLATTLAAQETKPTTTIRVLMDRAARGTLSDRRELVQGDSGKWNDKATLQHAPPIERKPQGLSIDNWSERIDKKAVATPDADNWIIFRSRQLDDNDRIWIERIERTGNEFTVILNEAIWQGNYFKTFTYYEVAAVNLGKLQSGDYTVRWLVKPLVFEHFEDPGKPLNNWPKDERPGKAKPVELSVAFSVKKL